MNLETLEKLLNDFNEQEAMADEEIKVVEEQIEALAKKIAESKERLELVAVDRQKVIDMKDRYAANGQKYAAVSNTSEKKEKASPKVQLTKPRISTATAKSKVKGEPVPVVAKKEPEAEPAAPEPAPVAVSPAADTEAAPVVAKKEPEAKPAASEPAPVAVSPAADTEAAEERTAAEEAAKDEDKGAEETGEDDDTVKSINDALRGLFR